jgi:hypothetical protein
MKAIVIGYPHQWHWVLSAEHALSESQEDVIFFDFSQMGLLSIFRPNFPFSANWIFRRQVIKYLGSKGIRVVITKIDFLNQIKSIFLSFTTRYPIVIDDSEVSFRSIYPSLVNDLSDTRILTSEYKTKIRIERSKSELMRLRLKNLQNFSLDSVVTVNGRFTNNYEVRLYAQEHGVKLSLLEFGSSKDSLEEYFNSPHSFEELSQKMRRIWSGTDLEHQRAKNFFEELVGFDRTAGISWTRNMVEGELPIISREHNLCVFYCSSQKEFVGVGDDAIPGHFKTQFEAFEALHSELSSNGEWEFFIRRHPNQYISQKDADGYYWDKYKNYRNTYIIAPNSPVDSYALGMKADLVAHFNSSIGIQLIYGGHNSVVTMGNAMWTGLVPDTLGRNLLELREFLANPLKSWKPESVLPWAYFRSSFGTKFRFFDFVSESTTWKFKDSET